jgi:hypothetical protein
MTEGHPAREASEYDMAMGRDPAGRQAQDERFAYVEHKDELTGDLAWVRDAHARGEIARAAAGFRQREADREAGS